MKLRLEDDPLGCSKPAPCPKIWSIEGDEERLFIQGKLPTAAERELFGLPTDEGVVAYPRAPLLAWVARQLSGSGR
jgi:hypothetical protein